MFRKYMPTAVAVALAIFMGSAVALADDASENAPAQGKLQIKPAVLTTTADQGSPITEVQYRRGYTRRGYYNTPYRSYRSYPSYRSSYRPSYSYYRPNYGYRGYSSYRPYYGYGGYSSYRPYNRSYYSPRYSTGYRGGFGYYGSGIGASFYW